MSWSDGLRRVEINGRQFIGASFRGVTFFVDNGDRGGGRRVVVHEFPFRDDPYIEDLGRRARTFRVDGYVIGEDYLTQRDNLLASLEDVEGPGELVHPYHGTMRAICTGLSVRESKTEGGLATFAIEFVRSDANTEAPIFETDGTSAVASAATAASASASADLEARYVSAGVPDFALSSVEETIIGLADRMEATLLPVVSRADEAAALSGRLRLMCARASALARSPADAFAAVTGALGVLVETAIEAPRALLLGILDAYGFDDGPLAPSTTPTRQRELANKLAMTGALRVLLVSEAAKLLPTIDYDSVDDAIADRDAITTNLDELELAAGDDVYPSLVALRAAVVQAVPSRYFASVLPLSLRSPVPSIVLSYRLFGSSAGEADIIARNSIAHPGAVVGEIKVLGDV